ncbi:MAG TPA: GtrA family protein [Candidatus Faecisoma merdavium]|nr:GtrA family protein [Candidatus Faecisoma merdavium]
MLNKLLNLYKKYKEIINYLIFGVLTTLISIVTYAIFTKVFHIDYLISNVLSWIIAVLFAYITNKIYVFESKSKKNIKEITSFFFFRVVSLIIEMIILYIFVDILHIDDLVTKIIAQIIVIVSNYVFSKVFVFNKN